MTAQTLDSNDRRSLDLQRAMENERANFAPLCKGNALFAGNLNCDCYSSRMSQARSQQHNNELAGDGVQVRPLLRELLPTAHLEMCASQERIKAYATKQMKTMSPSQSERDLLVACVPPQMTVLLQSDPRGFYEVSSYNGLRLRAMTSCSNSK